MIECSICKSQEHNHVTLARHLNSKHKNEFKTEKEFTLKKFEMLHGFNDEFYEKLKSDYKTNSVLGLSKQYCIGYKIIEKCLDILGEDTSIKRSTNIKEVRNKYKNTCLNKFGTDNVSKSEIIKDKKKQTFIENYGVDNIFKDPEFKAGLNEIIMNKYGVRRVNNIKLLKENLIKKYGVDNVAKISFVREKIKNTNIKRYGFETSTQNIDVRAKHKNTKANWTKEKRTLFKKRDSDAHKQIWKNLIEEDKNKILERLHNISSSKIEGVVSDCLTSYGITHQRNLYICFKQYDIYIKQANLIIEVNGDYWHANPNKYKENDLIKYPTKTQFAKDVWKKDFLKKNIAEDNGYKIIYIWECEIVNKTFFEIVNNIKFKIKEQGIDYDFESLQNQINKED